MRLERRAETPDVLPLWVRDAADLDREAILEVAHGCRPLVLVDSLLERVSARRHEVLRVLANGEEVYGVNTGTGSQSSIRLSDEELGEHQNALLLARAVGGPPWLDLAETRAVLAVRLRTFLEGDAGVSAELCQHLADFLNSGLWPAVPRGNAGSAGEIIPLSHAFGPLTGVGSCVSRPSVEQRLIPSDAVLTQAGISPLSLGPKEGIALLEGVPGSTALALLRVAETRDLMQQMIAVAAVGISLLRVNRDPYRLATARGDDELALVLGELWRLVGPEEAPRMLQAPVSFRVVGPALAHVERMVRQLEATVDRAMAAVTDSPAFLEGRFVGTAGFHGVDLAGNLTALAASIAHMAEVSAARLHRMMDPEITGLPHQLSNKPGSEAGLVVVHKRAVAAVRELRDAIKPTIVGSIETSSGQEDVQTFSWSAAESVRRALRSTREVLACELLALHQARGLAQRGRDQSSRLPEPLEALMSDIADVVPPQLNDRPFGVDVEAIVRLLDVGWGS